MSRVATRWRPGARTTPTAERLDRDVYEEQKYQRQIELLKFQYWSLETATKHVILFEGRDAAGKGGTIKRFMEHLNPRAARVARINAMRFFLNQFEYEGKDTSVVYPADPLLVQRGRDSING
ncbi:hypothetical protein [Actinoplanes sp. NPDC049118]|uniref:hypothetical protein n=1 Tax=Actinoplanes sp. NPDC049118 TaxID=3155769 RepID=UPI0033CDB058